MSKSKRTLLLFLQSTRVDTYINVIAHCHKREQINGIYFLIEHKPPEEEYKSKDLVNKLKTRVMELSQKYNEDNFKEYNIYFDIKTYLSDINDNSETLLSIKFNSSKEILNIIKKLELNKKNVILDVSGCTKKVSTDMIVSCLNCGIHKVCSFELSDIVFSDEWKNSKGDEAKLFHNLSTENNSYYGYNNFANIGITSKILNKLLKKEYLFNILLLILLACSILFLIYTFYNTSVQSYIKDFLSIILSIVLLVVNILNIKDKL